MCKKELVINIIKKKLGKKMLYSELLNIVNNEIGRNKGFTTKSLGHFLKGLDLDFEREKHNNLIYYEFLDAR